MIATDLETATVVFVPTLPLKQRPRPNMTHIPLPVRVEPNEANRLLEFCAGHEAHPGGLCLAGYVIRIDDFDPVGRTPDACSDQQVLDHLERAVTACLDNKAVVVRGSARRLVAVTEVADVESAERVATQMRTEVASRPFTQGLQEVRILVTVGGAVSVGRPTQPLRCFLEALIGTAAQALAEALEDPVASFQVDRLLMQPDGTWRGTKVQYPASGKLE